MLFDTHCHLNDDKLYEKRHEIIESAKEKGVVRFLCVGWDLESSRRAISIAHEYPEVFAAVGIHPENIEGFDLSILSEIKALAADPKVVAIGEIGLDYHWFKDPDHHRRQKDFFAAQIKIANEMNLPVSIHSRDASLDTYELLSNNPIKCGCSLHCYSGSPEMLLRFANLGCYFGFDGPVTFKNAIIPKESAKTCPIDRMLLETDSPYLAPTPFRGHDNTPEYLSYIAKKIAELKGMSVDKISDKTYTNGLKLFHVE